MQSVHLEHLPIPVAAHVAAPEANPCLVVAPTVDPACEHLRDLVGLGAQLVDPVESQPSVLTLILSLCL